MNISNEKTEDYDRPFITPISRAKLAIDKLIKETIAINVDGDTHKQEEKDDDEFVDLSADVPDEEVNEMIDKERLDKSLQAKYTLYFHSSYFSSVFQDILKSNEVEAKDVLNYTIAKMANKCERMLKKFDKLYKPLCMSCKIKGLSKEEQEDVERRKSSLESQLSLFLFNLLDSAFFIYSFNKQLNSTLKLMSLLNTIIIYLDNDYIETQRDKKAKTRYTRFTDDIRANVFKKIQDEINVVFQCSHYNENTQLETLYFLITLRSMRSKYRLSASAIENYLGVKKNEDNDKMLPNMNVLSITLLLYYFANGEEFGELRALVLKKVCERIKNVPKELRKKTSEIVILLLDLMACPYISIDDKRKVGKSFGLQEKEIKNLLRFFRNGRFMFTNWKKLNVTKELNAKISQEVYA